jgi:hypothetical protein
VRRLAAALVLLLAGAALAWARPQTSRWPPDGPPEWSLLAVGDTGRTPGRLPLRAFETQMRVAHALDAEDRREPVEALLLLGDLFYRPRDGSRPEEIDARVRSNLLEPYCRFLALVDPLPGGDAPRCRSGRRPVPVYAVVGNHDRRLGEPLKPHVAALPRYLANWKLADGPVEVVETGAGVSLVLYDPRALGGAGGAARLRTAVAAAAGPWRILASHYPLAARSPGVPWRDSIAALDVPVQLHLAGHEHNLQIGVVASPRPLLQVVAGGGSEGRAPRDPIEGVRFVAERPGFARVDLVSRPEGPRLRVSLVATGEWPERFWERPRVVARWSVGLAGDAREEPRPGG